MKGPLAASLCAFAFASAACGREEAPVEETPAAAEAPPAPIAGRYEVRGSTVAIASGFERHISGTVILATEGNSYTATFDLETTYPDPAAAEPIIAEVIGKGEGTIEGRTLRGTAQTQIVAATVPNVDPGFAFIPRSVSTRVISTSVTTISADGNVDIEIENRPAPGEEYQPTRTTLTGRRVEAAQIDKAPPASQ
jgi:hypothetical protein